MEIKINVKTDNPGDQPHTPELLKDPLKATVAIQGDKLLAAEILAKISESFEVS